MATKGAKIQLYGSDGTVLPSTTLDAVWFDCTTLPQMPTTTAYSAASQVTDADGILKVNLTSSALSIGQDGFMLLYKLDGGDHKDSLTFMSKTTLVDIDA